MTAGYPLSLCERHISEGYRKLASKVSLPSSTFNSNLSRKRLRISISRLILSHVQLPINHSSIMFGFGRTAAPAYGQSSRHHHGGVGPTYGNQHHHVAPSGGGHRSHHTTHTTHRRHHHGSPTKAVRYGEFSFDGLILYRTRTLTPPFAVETSSGHHTGGSHAHHTGHSRHSGGGHHHSGSGGGYGHTQHAAGGYTSSHNPVGGYIYGPPASSVGYGSHNSHSNTVGGYGTHPHQGYSSNHHSTKVSIRIAIGMC